VVGSAKRYNNNFTSRNESLGSTNLLVRLVHSPTLRSCWFHVGVDYDVLAYLDHGGVDAGGYGRLNCQRNGRWTDLRAGCNLPRLVVDFAGLRGESQQSL